MRHAPDTRRGGFTIIEVVLAMMILLIGMSSILGLLSFGATMTRTAELRTRAANAAGAVVTDLEETLFPLVVVDGLEVPGEPEVIERRPVPGHPGLVYSAQATPNPRTNALLRHHLEYRVDMEIFWSTGGQQRSKRFTTLLLREVPFGERLRRKFIERVEPKVLDAGQDE
jgi:type II secretory pathway component PulJ